MSNVNIVIQLDIIPLILVLVRPYAYRLPSDGLASLLQHGQLSNLLQALVHFLSVLHAVSYHVPRHRLPPSAGFPMGPM